MMERRVDKTRQCALLIDATPFAGQQMVAALGIDEYGRNMILGIRQGATENATVVGALVGELVERGFDFTEPRHYILDGAKAFSAAVKKHAGESAAIQRCQVHKRRNVLDHLTDEQKLGHLEAFFGPSRLRDITPLRVEEYQRTRVKVVRPATSNREMALLKHMFNMAELGTAPGDQSGPPAEIPAGG
jgi:hypothetical protein